MKGTLGEKYVIGERGEEELRKLVAFAILIALPFYANAEVISVITTGDGSMGHAGTSTDPLVPDETIGIAILLNFNYYPGWPDYDGYVIEGIDLELQVSGPGTLEVPMVGKVPTPVLQHHSYFGVWSQPYPLIEDNAIEQMAGVVLSGVITPYDDGGGGPGVLIWNLFIQCDGAGEAYLDLKPRGEWIIYPYNTDPLENGFVVTEDDLGDLTIYQIPEPMTIALLGLGGIFLLRRKQS
jgi:hypothetical protein